MDAIAMNSENVDNKSSEEAEIPKTFSSVTFLEDVEAPSSHNSNSTDSKSNNGENGLESLPNPEQVTITKDNAGNMEPEYGTILSENFSLPLSAEQEIVKTTDSTDRHLVQKKKSWSEIVGSSSPSSINYKDNEILGLESRMSHDDDAEKITNHGNGILEDQNQSRNQIMEDLSTFSPNIHNSIVLGQGGTGWSGPRGEDNDIFSIGVTNADHDGNKLSDVTKQDESPAAELAAVVESSHDYPHVIEDGFDAILGMNERKISDRSDFDEPSCTESFKQLSPFEFPAHAEKVNALIQYKIVYAETDNACRRLLRT